MTLDQFLDKWKAVPIRTRGILLIAALTLLLVGMAAAEHAKRLTGTEIILAARPVDPRDILRGAYVAIDYDIESAPAAWIEEVSDFKKAPAGPHTEAWLVLREVEGAWRVVKVLENKPRPAAGEALLRGEWTNRESVNRNDELALTYLFDIGADRYFTDEKTAKVLEKAIRDGEFKVVLSVSGDGQPVIKGLVLDGVRRDETFF